MATFIDNLKQRFKQKNLLIQVILINIAVFVVLLILGIIGKLFYLSEWDLISYVGVSSDLKELVKFWTPFTYMFVHVNFLHILFNMLMLYGFGQLFLLQFNGKTLGSLYILGGLAGALLYIVAFNTIPYYVDLGHAPMIGASASVMAIIFGIAFYNPQMKVRFLLFGEIRLVYIAVVLFIIDFIYLDSATNPGGHVAHIGGGMMGYLFAVQYRKGKDITQWVSNCLDWLSSLTKRQRNPKMKVKFKQREDDYSYNQRKHKEQQDIDLILDKIKVSGYASLTKDEKQKLFNASKK